MSEARRRLEPRLAWSIDGEDGNWVLYLDSRPIGEAGLEGRNVVGCLYGTAETVTIRAEHREDMAFEEAKLLLSTLVERRMAVCQNGKFVVATTKE